MKSSKYGGFFPYPDFRPFQEQMLDKVEEVVIKGNHTVLMIDAPTGSGKTSTIAPILANKSNKKFVVAVRTNSQIEIYLKEFDEIFNKTSKKPSISYMVGKEKTCKLSVKRGVCDSLVENTKKFIEYKINKFYLREYDASLDDILLEYSEQWIEKKEPINIQNIIDENEINIARNNKEFLICPYFLFSKIGYTNNEGKIEFLNSYKIESKAQEFLNHPVPPNQIDKINSDVCSYEFMSLASKKSDAIIIMHAHILQESTPIYLKLGIKSEETILLIDEAHNIGETAEQKNSQKLDINLISSAIKQIEDFYTFFWNDVPGKDNFKLLGFLSEDFNLNFTTAPEIKKIEDDKTISISNEKSSVLIRLNDEETTATITIDNVRTDEFLVEKKNVKLKIFDYINYNNKEIKNNLHIAEIVYFVLIKLKNILEKLHNENEIERILEPDLLIGTLFNKNIDSLAIENIFSNMISLTTRISGIDSINLEDEDPLIKCTQFLYRINNFNNQYILRKGQDSDEINKKIILEIKNFDPSPILSKIVDSHYTTIMMSGTFSPIDFYELYYFGKNGRAEKCSLPNSFPAQNRLIIGIKDANTIFINRDDSSVIKNYYNCMYKLIIDIPGNVALFFNSYDMKKQYTKYCSETARKADKEFFDQKSSVPEDEIFEKFKKAGKNKGGVLLALSGGKLSEGKDYSGDSLKAAMVVGFPLGPINDIQKRKNEYYKSKYGEEKGDFIAYKLPAMNKALQALGRVIRAKDETGILILADTRFAKEGTNSIGHFLPPWIKDEIIFCNSTQISDILGKWRNDRENNLEIEWYKKGVELNKLGKYNDAIESYKKAIKINPRNEKTWNNIGSVFFKLKMYPDAVESYKKALKIDPSNDLIIKNQRKATEKIKDNNLKDSSGRRAGKRL